MTHQSEQILEDNLIKQLQELKYKYIVIKDESDLLGNLKSQLEKHNKLIFSGKEFKKILNHLNKGNVFEKAKILRDKMSLTKDDGTKVYVEFMQLDHWCQNQFQVTRQVAMEGSYKNRYDVTLLVNGLPLVQIELKRRGLELKEAFHQINRYQRHSFGASQALFNYIQIFIISNGVNTKYYANNRKQSFKQTFYWSNKENKPIKELKIFAKLFLEPCHISKMIAKYVVLNETNKILMVLRPYQYYATETIIDRVKHGRKNGYIWHTTGSGKTLTSFKTSQILMELPKVQKVVFVVDRKDLDYQTLKEFNAFSKGSVDASDNTANLVKQFRGDYKNKKGELASPKLMITTIQKLNNAIRNKRHLAKMESQKDERIVFIFDECHRSQFGETHKRIKSFFTKAQMFGFTGTPIFAENAVRNELGKRTTKELFEECLHKYVITDAIRDENVLKFSVEYIGRYIEKKNSNAYVDISVEGIDTQELLESPQRLDKISDYIIANHNRKTHGREFTSIFCVSSIDALIKYYELFASKKKDGQHNLSIATIFSYTVNEDDKDANGLIMEEDISISKGEVNVHTRDKLDIFIEDYNKQFKTKFTTKDSVSFYNYYKDISKKVKERKVDILLVVNMFLTGFDSTWLNTIYVDKNLKYHGLIQAYSRTNRILNEQKSQGNVVCFRNLKKATDDAITLFSNKNAKEIIMMEPYEVYVRRFNEVFADLLKIAPTVQSVDDLRDEEEELAFIQAFRQLMRVKNVLTTFVDFDWDDLAMTEQKFEDYKSKYLDLYDKVKSNAQVEKVSILEDVDFELELLHRDEINVVYILRLLAKFKESEKGDQEKVLKQIFDLLEGDVYLRSKRELIKKFIEENLPHVDDPENIEDAFEDYCTEEQRKAFDDLCKSEKIIPAKFDEVVNNYLFSNRKPLRDEVLNTLKGEKPRVRERKNVAERIIDKLVNFVDTYIHGMSGRNSVQLNSEQDETFDIDVVPEGSFPESLKHVEYLPLFSVEAFATNFGEEASGDEIIGWWKNTSGKKISNDMYIAQVKGHSMEPTIKDGEYCIFNKDRGGTREGKIVLVAFRDVSDPETMARYTIKRYHSEKNTEEVEPLQKKIVLSPANPMFEDIVLEKAEEFDYQVVGVFVEAIKALEN